MQKLAEADILGETVKGVQVSDCKTKLQIWLTLIT